MSQACSSQAASAPARRPDSTTSAHVSSPASGRTPARADALAPSSIFPVRQLAKGVYAVLGDTGRGSEGRPNAGFVVTDEGVVVIDALASPAQGERLLRTIRTVTQRPVRWLILTHHHPDHHFGGIVFRRAGARVIAHPERATLAAEGGEDQLVASWTEVVGAREMAGFAFANVPDIPVTRATTLRLGGRTIVVSHPGPAHTPSDLIVWLPEERVLFAGDLLIEDGVTMVVDGNSRVLLNALDRLDSLAARFAVPGHGRLSDDPRALTQLTRCYVHGVRKKMQAAFAEGAPMGRALNRVPPADPDRPVSRNSRERRNAVRVYLEMEREAMNFDEDADSAGAEPAGGGADGRSGRQGQRADSARVGGGGARAECEP